MYVRMYIYMYACTYVQMYMLCEHVLTNEHTSLGNSASQSEVIFAALEMTIRQ